MSVGGTFGNIQLGITDDQTIDTTSGELVLSSANGSVEVSGGARVTDVLTVDTITFDTGSITDTTGQISFGNENLVTTGGGTFASLYIDQTANATAVTIDTAATSADMLTIDGTTLTTGRALQITVDNSLTTGKALQVYNAATGTFVLSADDAHVGIGTSDPDRLLHVSDRNASSFEYLNASGNTYLSTALINARSSGGINAAAMTAYIEASAAPADSYAGLITGYHDYDGSEPNLGAQSVFGINAVNYFDGDNDRDIGAVVGGIYTNRTGPNVANLDIGSAYGIIARSFQGEADGLSSGDPGVGFGCRRFPQKKRCL
jgi:hypothetical protein